MPIPFETGDRGFANCPKWRVHKNRVIFLAAEINESEALCRIFGEETALNAATAFCQLGVVAQCNVDTLLDIAPEIFGEALKIYV